MYNISTKYKFFILFLIFFFSCSNLSSQPSFDAHLSFKTAIEDLGNDEYNVKIICTLDKGWHVYSQFTSEGGPLPTRFVFVPNKEVKLIGKVKEVGKLEKKMDELFGVEVSSFAKTVTFVQKVKLLNKNAILQGEFDGQVCKDEEGCMPFGPEKFSFSFGNIPALEKIDTLDKSEATTPSVHKNNISNKFDWQYAENACSAKSEKKDKSIFLIFFFGFIGGLIALLTPCVFPMVPLTVSFFTKGGKDTKQGLRKALTYGLSIIVIYILLGLIITSLFGSDALNAMSTNIWFNILFFIVFIVFAFSFFGFYEITLPASWANKSDSLASKGGNIGIFFMAFTLALVSFSCTGPIIGTLLVEAATGGGPTILGRVPIKPTVGMLGFSFALALPFTLFAMFPQWLQSLPKSGGWMNTVKVTLGFVELALAFKFLSVADMTQNWGILRVEIFLLIWIILFLLLTMYLFGFFNLFKPTDKEKIGNIRRVFALFFALFVCYLSYGLLAYKPLKILSGLAPPVSYNFKSENKESFLHFKDYDEGLAYAKQHNLPILIDFTGHGCVNCRKIEEHVWTNKIIESLLKKYVVISLYVDDRKTLEPKDWYTSEATGVQKEIKTVGQKWSDFQALHFKTNSQPYYVIINHEEKILNQPVDYAYASDIGNYQKFLECGIVMQANISKK